MVDRNDIKARLMATFRVEAEEHVQALTAHLLALEHGLPAAEVAPVMEATFREMHTLKGAARSVSLTDIEALCQACEAVLSRLTRGRAPLTRSTLDLLREAVDSASQLVRGSAAPAQLGGLIDRLGRTATEPVGEAAEAHSEAIPASPDRGPHGSPLAEALRVPTARLDALSRQVEDLLVPKLAAAERTEEARLVAQALAECRAILDDSREAGRPGRAAGGSGGPAVGLEAQLRAASSGVREIIDHLARDERALAGTVDGLMQETRSLRMTAASSVLGLFPGMVRDLAGEGGKRVEWTERGADVEVDRSVLEAMKDPLIHLVRNAIDHGIEPEAERAQAGKPPRGRLLVSIASLEGGRIEIRVEDDGRGIDLGRVRGAALRTRILTPEAAEKMTDGDALDLVFRSGLSTSPIITSVSGHGLGLAIVKERVERLGGRIVIETRAGRGTTVAMVVPASIATFRGLLVRAGGRRLLLPVDAVERAIHVAPGDIEAVEGREAMRQGGRPLFLARLSALLDLGEPVDPAPDDGQRPCLVLRSGEERLGLLVEEVLGDQEALVKDLRPPLVRVRNVAAAGLLGTGEVVPILRPADLFKSSRRAPRPVPAAPGPEPKGPLAILVVDDSITTRTMEKNILEAAGYRVRVAVDGLDAWTALRSDGFDLVVSDIDMPRLDGFDLTARIRADRKLSGLPVVLVTALESREDKERGIEVGANAYLVKSSFDQSNLLEIIRRLA